MISPEDLKNDLIEGLEDIGLSKGENCYISGNVTSLARTRLKKDILLPTCLSSFQEVIGQTGTVFSPSASMNLCNTEIPFDIDLTPSHQMGAFAEYIRQASSSVRTFHPFWSITGIGKHADILRKVSRHSYGVGSPWSKFIDLDILQINIGLHPSKAVTLIHHVEVITGVPYRYTKEFIHPIVKSNGEITKEPFYMSVMYRDSDIVKRLALNEHYFHEMEKRDLVKSFTHSSGFQMWAFKMQDFYKVASEFFMADIYNYLENPPEIRPYNL